TPGTTILLVSLTPPSPTPVHTLSLHDALPIFGSQAVRGGVELGFPNVRTADEEGGGRAVLLGERSPLRAQVTSGLLPVVLPEELLRPLEARLRGRGSRPGQDREEEEERQRDEGS